MALVEIGVGAVCAWGLSDWFGAAALGADVPWVRSGAAFDAEPLGRRAADVMRTDLISMTENAPVVETIRIVTEHSLKRLSVVSADGAFRGMVSREGLLRSGIEAPVRE